MRITFLYNNFADNGLGVKSRTFECVDEKSILEMVLWLTATELLPERPTARKVHEVIVNKHHFKTDKYLNPCDWVLEIKQSILTDEFAELKRKAESYDKLSGGGKKSSANMTPEQRRERAKKAVAARIAKYGQKSKS